MKSNRDKSLRQLDDEDWGKPIFDSHLVTTCHRLRHVPLRDFSIENLRIVISQNIGLEHLVPLALERLQDDPFAEGDFYPGDLLVSLLHSDPKFWQDHPDLRNRIVAIAQRAISLFPTTPDVATKTVTRAMNKAYAEFQKQQAKI